MADIEKVIEGLKRTEQFLIQYEFSGHIQQVHDAIELLKEQEAVKPEPIMGTSISDCGKCRHAVAPGMNYCPVCGCRIDWN